MGQNRARMMGLAASVIAAAGAVSPAGVAVADATTPTTTNADELIAYLRQQGTQAAFDQLSEAQREAVRQAVTETSEAEETGAIQAVSIASVDAANATARAAGGERCWTSWYRRKGTNSVGKVLFTYWQGLEWCGKNGGITHSRVYDRGGETSTPGWSYEGHGGSGKRIVGSEVRQYTQEKFKLVIGIGPVNQTVQSPTKCIQLRANAKGGAVGSGSCAL